MHIKVGARLPSTTLARVEAGLVQQVSLDKLLFGRRVLVLGVPGAFTPTCTSHHVPDFVSNSSKLLASGFSCLICIAANDPWTVAEWAKRLDPERRLLFLSDGNLDLARALGLDAEFKDQFLGRRSRRYLLTVKDAVLESVSAEATFKALTCTRVCDLPIAA